MKKYCPSFILTFLLTLIIFTSPVQAAETMSLTTTPVRVGDDGSLTLLPGEKKQVQMKVRNNTDLPVMLESHAVDFIIADDGQTPLAVTDQTSERWSLASWLTLVPAVHQLEAGGTAVVNVLIEVPEDALPGGHYAMIYHNPEVERQEGSSASGISQRVGTLLYVIVDGDIQYSAAIQKFNWPKFRENGPVDFSLEIDNQSDVHLQLSPQVTVYNLFGKEVAQFKLEEKNVFPFSQRSFDSVWEKVWGFGYYKAVAEVVYSDQGQVATAVAGMWMIPVKLLLLLSIGILLIVIIFVSLKKRNQEQTKVSVPSEKGDGSIPDDSTNSQDNI